MWVVEANGDVFFGAGMHELGGDANFPAKGDDAFEVVERDAKFDFFLKANFDGFALFLEPGSIEGDE
jgi:hypothetical protein